MSWPLIPISDFCVTGSGGTPSRKNPEYYIGDIPWVKSGDLRENIVTRVSENISHLAIEKSSAKIVPQGAILLAMYGATVGRMAILGIDAATNQAVCNIIPDTQKADQKYVYYALRDKVPMFLRNAVGGAQPNINQGMIKETKIPLPPLPEQKRIAAILDKADAIRRKRQQAIDLADQYLRSVFLDMFGDPVTNPKGWEAATVGEVVTDVKDGPHVSPTYADEGIPILSTRNIRPRQLVMEQVKYITPDSYDILTKRFKPEKGDVLLTKGGTTGFAKVVDFPWPFAVWVHLAVLRPNNLVLPEYLEELLNTQNIYLQSQKFTRGIANKDLGLTRIVQIEFSLPPLELQRSFVAIRKRTLSTISKFEESINFADNQFNALSQQAFAGKL